MVTPIEQARQVGDKLRSEYASTTANSEITEQAKANRMTRAYGAAAQQMRTLSQAHDAYLETQRLALERRIFGLPATMTASDKISFRDARDRAAKLETEREATDAFEDARSIGDDEVVQAIAARSVAMGWTRISEKYLTDIRPGAGVLMNQLEELVRPSTGQVFEDGAAFWLPLPPGRSTSTPQQVEFEADLLERGAQVEA